jgi:hypothetical protein
MGTTAPKTSPAPADAPAPDLTVVPPLSDAEAARAALKAELAAEIEADLRAKLTAELTPRSPAVKREAKKALASAMIAAMGDALKALPADHPANLVGSPAERDQIVAQWVHHFPADRETWTDHLPAPVRAGW